MEGFDGYVKNNVLNSSTTTMYYQYFTFFNNLIYCNEIVMIISNYIVLLHIMILRYIIKQHNNI